MYSVTCLLTVSVLLLKELLLRTLVCFVSLVSYLQTFQISLSGLQGQLSSDVLFRYLILYAVFKVRKFVLAPTCFPIPSPA